jgi:hypothetical protein
MDLARELQNALGRCRFARIHVGKNADVAIRIQVFHVFTLISQSMATTWFSSHARALTVSQELSGS